MQNEETNEKTDVAKLFIILMALAAFGFAIGAAYIYHAKSGYEEIVQSETRAMQYLVREARSEENKPYWGFEAKGSGAMKGSELSSYLGGKAKMHGVPFADTSTDPDPNRSKGYMETTVNVKQPDVTIEQVVRYLYNIKRGQKDILIPTLRLSNFDYEPAIPLCDATFDVVVYEDLKPPAGK